MLLCNYCVTKKRPKVLILSACFLTIEDVYKLDMDYKSELFSLILQLIFFVHYLHLGNNSGEQLSRRIPLCSQLWLIALKQSPFLSVKIYHSIIDEICWTHSSWRNGQVSNIFHWNISRAKYLLQFFYIFMFHLHVLIFVS